MGFYTKKPVTIEAIEFNGNNWQEIIDFAGKDCMYNKGSEQVMIITLEGMYYANIGDMIIKGIKGEFYPCKPNIFWATYGEAKGEGNATV